MANLLARGEPFNTQIQTNFNPFLPGICERQRALGRQVYFNDLRSAVPLSDMPDNLHPNQIGYNKMATNWFGAIHTLVCTNCPPRFTLQPASQAMLPGTNITLVAEATGAGGSIQYQWRFEGTNIPNATNASYSFTNGSLIHQGKYSVAATDANGTTLSSTAVPNESDLRALEHPDEHQRPIANAPRARERPQSTADVGALLPRGHAACALEPDHVSWVPKHEANGKDCPGQSDSETRCLKRKPLRHRLRA